MKQAVAAAVILLAPTAFAQTDPVDIRSVAEAWGDDAKVTNCFDATERVGYMQGSLLADYRWFNDINRFSLGHRADFFKICVDPVKTYLLKSVGFTLATTDPETGEKDNFMKLY
jgi:hypothetical protein